MTETTKSARNQLNECLREKENVKAVGRELGQKMKGIIRSRHAHTRSFVSIHGQI